MLDIITDNGINVSPSTLCWRLVYENGKIIVKRYTKGKTSTMKTLECYLTEDEVNYRIKELKLENR